MKTLASLVLVVLLIPNIAIAQVKPPTISEDDSFVWDALIVLIVNLTNQIDSLKAELAYYKSLQTIQCVAPNIPVIQSEQTTPTETNTFGTIQVDNIPPQVTTFQILNGFFRVFSNEPLDIIKTTGINIGNIIWNGKQDSLFKNTGKMGYYYEIESASPKGEYTATIQDLSGNKLTRVVVSN